MPTAKKPPDSVETPRSSSVAVKGTFWTVAVFYVLIAFEFFYMAAPFGVYFYSVSLPGLAFLDRTPGLGWLTQFFLPHIAAETRCALVDSHDLVGAVLTGVGLLAFTVGALQVYYRKLTRKGPAVGGLYRFIRHPQYTALATAGLGMLLLWPRFLVLVLYVAMLFGYYLLSLMEERECARRFGRPYLEYMERTSRFVPLRIPGLRFRKHSNFAEKEAPPSRGRRVATALLACVAVFAAFMGAALLLERWSVGSLYALTTRRGVYVSVGRINKVRLERLARISRDDPEVRQRLAAASRNVASPRFINYVLPANWCVSEIPMHPPASTRCGHSRPRPDQNRYTVVFTRAELPDRTPASGRKILLKTRRRIPVLQIKVDLNQGRVVELLDPNTDRYPNVPVPIF